MTHDDRSLFVYRDWIPCIKVLRSIGGKLVSSCYAVEYPNPPAVAVAAGPSFYMDTAEIGQRRAQIQVGPGLHLWTIGAYRSLQKSEITVLAACHIDDVLYNTPVSIIARKVALIKTVDKLPPLEDVQIDIDRIIAQSPIDKSWPTANIGQIKWFPVVLGPLPAASVADLRIDVIAVASTLEECQNAILSSSALNSNEQLYFYKFISNRYKAVLSKSIPSLVYVVAREPFDDDNNTSIKG